jgi:restriction endonuclease S subunit
MKLGDYSIIRTGLVFSRKQAEPNQETHIYSAISLRNIVEGGYLLSEDVEIYQASEALKGEYFTHVGDILMRLSAPYTSALISENEKGLLVPSHFAIIRVNKDVIPAYLHWWLMENRKRFYKVASGTSMMGTISSGYIADMPFAPPPHEIQKQIGELLSLANQEQKLLTTLAEKKKLLINTMLKSFAEQGE